MQCRIYRLSVHAHKRVVVIVDRFFPGTVQAADIYQKNSALPSVRTGPSSFRGRVRRRTNTDDKMVQRRLLDPKLTGFPDTHVQHEVDPSH